MKVTKEAVRILAGVAKTCLVAKGECVSISGADILVNFPKGGISAGEIPDKLGIEAESIEKIQELAIFLGKDLIDQETILRFFGGTPHTEHVSEDFLDSGLSEKVVNLLLVFHAVIAVSLEERDGKLVGIYTNRDLSFELQDLDVLDGVMIDHSQKALAHYGTVFESVPIGSDQECWLVEAQRRNQSFMETCRKEKSLDVGKLLKAFQFGRGK